MLIEILIALALPPLLVVAWVRVQAAARLSAAGEGEDCREADRCGRCMCAALRECAEGEPEMSRSSPG
jgi:hypothetical protein